MDNIINCIISILRHNAHFFISISPLRQLPRLLILLTFVCIFNVSISTAGVSSKAQSYVVYMGSHSSPNADKIKLDRITSVHHNLLSSVLGSEDLARKQLLYSYKHYINGFAAIMEPDHASALSAMPGVISVFPNRAHQLHTTRSWEFLGLEHPSGHISSQSLWKKAKFGDNVIVGVLDTGVWPESESYNDKGFGPIPERWKGICEEGTNFTAANCNRKLIGARFFVKGYQAANGGSLTNLTTSGDFLSPRDKEGHGTHTSSTATGVFVKGANIFGFAKGTAKGGAPAARLAVYKVCWPGGCYDADILAAFDAGIHDGVNVFSLSIGSAPPLVDLFADAIAVGSLHAVSEGRIVVCSAGNDGPTPASVSNVAPWIITVAASSIDRKFPASAVLGDGSKYIGASLSETKLEDGLLYPLVFSGDVKLDSANVTAGQLCFPGSLDPEKVKGKIVACIRGVTARVNKGTVVKQAGGAGLILLNKPTDADEIVSDPHVLPATQLSSEDAKLVLTYINSSRSSAKGFITAPKTQLNAKPAPQMASFSSQGPNSLIPEILKPDITAPGLNILAAWTQASAATADTSDHRLVKYNVISGTSMSCPHAAGVAALLRALYPTWSPAAIKSAMMTSASHHDNAMHGIRNGSLITATAFNYGAGHVNPNVAADPGLIYDANTADYLRFLKCGLGYNSTSMANFTASPSAVGSCNTTGRPVIANLNLPSFSIYNLSLSSPITVTRAVTFVGGSQTFTASVVEPRGVAMEVRPEKLEFSKVGEIRQFSVSFHLLGNGKAANFDSWSFGSLTWSDGRRLVASPVAVRAVRQNLDRNLEI